MSPLAQHSLQLEMFKFPIGSMVLLYMVLHASHQYTPFMLAYIAAPWILWGLMRRNTPCPCDPPWIVVCNGIPVPTVQNEATLRCVTVSIKGRAFSNLRKSAHIQVQSISHICVSARSQTQDQNLEKTSCKTIYIYICKTEFRTPNPPQILKTNRSSQTPTLQHVTPIRKAEQTKSMDFSRKNPGISHWFFHPCRTLAAEPNSPELHETKLEPAAAVRTRKS